LVRKELIGLLPKPKRLIARISGRSKFVIAAVQMSLDSNPEGAAPDGGCSGPLFELHGEERRSAKGVERFTRYVRLMKEAWSGRYADAMTDDDMRDYRERRRKQGMAESTINREQTAIITMFKLVEWRRAGQIQCSFFLPDGNPGRGVKKVNEDLFIRECLLSDEEYKNLWACADPRTRRIILAEMNLPLRLEDLKQLNEKNVNYKLGRSRACRPRPAKNTRCRLTRSCGI
jgi:hypothetical protein